MTRATITRPEDVKVVPKPWGEERWLAHTDRYAGKILILKKGHRLSLQYHEIKDETLRVLDGSLELQLGPDVEHLQTHNLEAGAVFHVSPGTLHRMIAIADCRLLEVSTNHLDDVVRLEDRYGREGTSTP